MQSALLEVQSSQSAFATAHGPMLCRVLQQRAATASSVAGPAAASAASKASAKPIQKTGVPQKAGPASSPTS